MADTEYCNFCSPAIKEILDVVPFEPADLVIMRDAIEIHGKKMMCGDSRNNCEPLRRIQLRLNKLKKENNG